MAERDTNTYADIKYRLSSVMREEVKLDLLRSRGRISPYEFDERAGDIRFEQDLIVMRMAHLIIERGIENCLVLAEQTLELMEEKGQLPDSFVGRFFKTFGIAETMAREN